MIAAFADILNWRDQPADTVSPTPPRQTTPVLMADILTSRGGEPEILIRWREDRPDKGD